jgi:hypothetical protein
MLTRDKHRSLLSPFVSYEENEVLRMQLMGLLDYVKLERLTMGKHYSLLGPFFVTKKMELLIQIIFFIT